MPGDRDRPYESEEIKRYGQAAILNPDAKSLHGLAHPVRMQIFELLRFEGPATVTTVAQRVGVAVGSASWHLHKLAEHGYIEEIPDRGSRRERWWRSIFDKVFVEYAEAMEAGPDQAQAATDYFTVKLSYEMARAIRFINQDWDFEWRYPAIINTYEHLVLDPDNLEQMRTELWELVERYIDNPSTSPQARRVIFSMQGYPYRTDDERTSTPAPDPR